jgi:hypothetical protein
MAKRVAATEGHNLTDEALTKPLTAATVKDLKSKNPDCFGNEWDITTRDCAVCAVHEVCGIVSRDQIRAKVNDATNDAKFLDETDFSLVKLEDVVEWAKEGDKTATDLIAYTTEVSKCPDEATVVYWLKQFLVENKDTMLCASCNKSSRDTKSLYPTVREMFLRRMIEIDEKCPVTKIPIDMSDDIHHKMGRVGYADKWAYDNDIPLIIDVRYFLAVKRVAHQRIELNRTWALDNGYTIKRSESWIRK